MLLAVGAASSTAPMAAETVYVTDMLYLGLREAPEESSRQLATLTSGTRLEVLDRRKHYAQVRTPDGQVGWAKSAYLVTETPPRLILEKLRAQNGSLEQRLGASQQALEKAKKDLAKAREELAALQQGAESDRAALSRLREKNEASRQRAAANGLSVPASWALGAAAGCLAVGLMGGRAWLDRTIRKRHGGFRIR